ncbi:MAG: hypothetical protein R2729_17310 [Bryobacteraceae bacterium]
MRELLFYRPKMNPPGEAITLWTVRAAFACYLIALHPRLEPRRAWWTAGFAFFAAHVAAAFHFYHHWSHAAAWLDTQRQTAALMGGRGWGGGLWFNYVFAAVWAADVARTWLGAKWGRPWRIFVQVFFAFLFFNATVVFGHGAIRWTGAAGFLWLGLLAARNIRFR